MGKQEMPTEIWWQSLLGIVQMEDREGSGRTLRYILGIRL